MDMQNHNCRNIDWLKLYKKKLFCGIVEPFLRFIFVL